MILVLIIDNIPIILLGIALINKILRLNREAPCLAPYRNKAIRENTFFSLENGLLYYKSKLVVLEEEDARTHLIRNIHSQIPITYVGKAKTRKLV